MKSEIKLPANPIPEILKNISLSPAILTPLYLDELRKIVFQVTDSVSFVTNSYIVLLLKHLHENGLVELSVLNPKDVEGEVFIIRKIENGEST